MNKHTIFLALSLLKHWFCMWLAAQTTVSSFSWVNRFTALSNVISGGLFSDFLCEKTATNEKMYHHRMPQNMVHGLNHRSRRCKYEIVKCTKWTQSNYQKPSLTVSWHYEPVSAERGSLLPAASPRSPPCWWLRPGVTSFCGAPDPPSWP